MGWCYGFVIQEENIGNVKEHLSRVFEESLRITVPDEAEVAPIIAPCARKEAGDYQWYMLFNILVHNL